MRVELGDKGDDATLRAATLQGASLVVVDVQTRVQDVTCDAVVRSLRNIEPWKWGPNQRIRKKI